jgi:hypothetical protein
MARLGRVLTEAVVLQYGRDEMLRRLSHPFWFQSFGAVMGMDWHSSGITTSVLGALKRGLAPVQDELGLYVCGGRGRHSRRTPDELRALGDRLGLDGDGLTRASRLVAKVDSAAVQDGYALYLHGFVVTRDGHWAVVQQGMNDRDGLARRYHWLSEGLTSFVDEPHAAIDGRPHGEILNMTDHRAVPSREAQVALAREPGVVLRELHRFRDHPPHLAMPAHHEVRVSDVGLRRLAATLAAAADRAPHDFAELLLTPGVGARTVEALALVAEVMHGVPSRFSDPARFSYAHGGKDGHPFPVPIDVYDRTLTVMRQAVEQAKLGNDERLQALQRLDRAARRLEQVVSMDAEQFERLLQRENERSSLYGGRTVSGFAPPQAAHSAVRREQQLALDYEPAGPPRSRRSA